MKFKESKRWEVKNHILSGITFFPLLEVFRRHFRDIEWLYYAHRVLFLVGISCFHSLVAFFEDVLYKRRIERQDIHPEPVFVLGHPRTGTTHLHNLLALDGGRFGYCTTFQAGFPSTFLLLERFSWVLSPLMDKTRPMDQMKLSFELPQEDEIATNAMSGGISPYMQIVIMKGFEKFKPYFRFGDDCPPEDRDKWEKSFLFFLRKLTFRHGYKPLVIKSPVHTARVKTLLGMFPKAKFIYIHRDPYEVFQSASHMADSYYWFCYLNRPREKDIKQFILQQYQLLYEAYVEERKLLSDKKNLIEVSFSELDQHPLALLTQVYDTFGFGWSSASASRVQQYMGRTLADFKKNAHKELDEESVALVNEHWRDSFDTFGYRVRSTTTTQ